MLFISNSRKLLRVLNPVGLISADVRFVSSVSRIYNSNQWRNFVSPMPTVSSARDRCVLHSQTPTLWSMKSRANFSSDATELEGNPTEAVKELHGKILDSINVKRSAPPNAWLWSLMESCQNKDDITLLFEILEKFRVFRMSKLRFPDNYNAHLCQQVAKTCVRAGAISHGKRTLYKHNIYGFTPSVASAHHLLSYAQEHKDVKLMEEVIKLLKRNDVPLQPGTADIVFRICHEADEWNLLVKYSKKFARAQVKLRKTTFEEWMKFAAKRGDIESLWKVEQLRSATYDKHTLSSALSCAKGLVLEHKPKEAADVIRVTCQAFPDGKKSCLTSEFKKLVHEWPVDVIKSQKEEDKKEVAASLKSNMVAMVNELVNSGLDVKVDLDELNKKEALLSS